LNDAIYQQAIKDLARLDHGSGRLIAPDRSARLDNPLCGDRIDIEIGLAAGGAIAELAHRTKGCLLCRASASVLGLHAPGLRIAEIESIRAALDSLLQSNGDPTLPWPELALFAPVRAHRSRHGCVLLPWRALEIALRA
jgi:nitrogen fixation protein NifU and related proteins